MRKIYSKLIIILFIAYLLLFPDTAFQSARNGILLWFNKILPCLLPFCVLSSLILSANMIQLKKPSIYVLIAGCLFGFPMGAKTAADMVRQGTLTTKEASYLVPVSNMFSPVFLSGYFVEQCLQKKVLMVPTFLILYGSAFVVLLFFLLQTHHISLRATREPPVRQITFTMIDKAIMDSFGTMVKLCGYIMLFSILAGMVTLIPLHSDFFKAVITGITEVTNGIDQITSLSIPIRTKYLILMPLISFGGLSGIAQTASFCKGTGISMGQYVMIRGIISLITFAFTYLFLYLIL